MLLILLIFARWFLKGLSVSDNTVLLPGVRFTLCKNRMRFSTGQGHHLQSPDAVIKIKLQDLPLIMLVIIEVISVIILRSRQHFLWSDRFCRIKLKEHPSLATEKSMAPTGHLSVSLWSCYFIIWEKNKSANIVKLTFYRENIFHWVISDFLKTYCIAYSWKAPRYSLHNQTLENTLVWISLPKEDEVFPLQVILSFQSVFFCLL